MVSTPPWATREANRSIVEPAECEWVVLIVPVIAVIGASIAWFAPDDQAGILTTVTQVLAEHRP